MTTGPIVDLKREAQAIRCSSADDGAGFDAPAGPRTELVLVRVIRLGPAARVPPVLQTRSSVDCFQSHRTSRASRDACQNGTM